MLRRISIILIVSLFTITTGYAEQKREKYIFYLTSQSVPFVSVKSIIEQSQKINTRLIIVLYGIDNDRTLLRQLDSVVDGKKVLIKIHPYIFEDNVVKQVPAFISADCPQYNDFQSQGCNYENIVYGDISLVGFLKIVKDYDSYFNADYDNLGGL